MRCLPLIIMSCTLLPFVWSAWGKAKPEDLPPNALDIPEGDYKSSCNGCSVVGETLRCSHCAKKCGRRVPSELSVNCDMGSLVNTDGKLTCQPKNADHLPPGTYSSSCHGCSISDTALSCVCLDGAGAAHSASILLAGCLDIGNEQGKLVCTTRSAVTSSPPHDELWHNFQGHAGSSSLVMKISTPKGVLRAWGGHLMSLAEERALKAMGAHVHSTYGPIFFCVYT